MAAGARLYDPDAYRIALSAIVVGCVIGFLCTLAMRETVLPDRVQVSLGSLDRPDLVRPDDHVWTSSQLPWLEVADGLPRFATISDAVPSRAGGGGDER